MANISIKSQKITPFGGIFHVMDYIGPVVDGELGLRCTTFGYQYSEIARLYTEKTFLIAFVRMS